MTNYDYVQATIDLSEDGLRSRAPIVILGALTERIGYSARHLSRLFQALCGQSLGQYLLRR